MKRADVLIDVAKLRAAERKIERELRLAPLRNGRSWHEHRPGFKAICGACVKAYLSVMIAEPPPPARLWIGTYFVFSVLPGVPPYTVHSSDPLCAYHVADLMRREWHLPIWRPKDGPRAIAAPAPRRGILRDLRARAALIREDAER